MDAERVKEPLIHSIRAQWKLTMELLKKSIRCFSDNEWITGISDFEVPWRDDPKDEYRQISPRFEKDWWQLGNTLSQSQILTFAEEYGCLSLGLYQIFSLERA